MTKLTPLALRLAATLIAFTALAASAQQPLQTILVDLDHRPSTSLDGPWHYLIDEPGTNLYTPDGKIKDNTYALNEHPNLAFGSRTSEYDFATAPNLNVPGDWNTQDPTIFRYEGVVWYERDFAFTPTPNTRTFLHIGAANYRSHVWVNGHRLCDHEGGFTPFDCDATSLLHAGGNFVVIAVDSTRLNNGIPSVVVDWFNYGGLTRDVSLVTVPTQFIDDYTAHLDAVPAPGKPSTVSGYVHVEGASVGMPVTITIPEAHLSTSATTDASGRAAFSLPATSALTLWSPDSPKLYRITLTAGADKLSDDIGFRTIHVDGTRILLNDKPIFLRGVCMQGEAPIRTGRISTQADVSTLFSYVQDLHANFIRIAHYPNDERVTRTADRLGIMIWSEIPLWQHIAFGTPGVYEKADFMLHEMIRRDRNLASVIFWSVSNETPNEPVRTEFLTRLANSARTIDPTRPITSALNSEKIDAVANTVTLDDKFADALDLIGVNEYIGWYVGPASLADKVTWTLPNKPIIMSEFGAEAKFGDHGETPLKSPPGMSEPTHPNTLDPKDQRWTEESQANVYQHQFDMLAKIPQLRGITPWVLMDFRSPTRNIPHLQDGFNRKGLLSDQGQKKEAFFVLQKQYEHLTIGKPE
jgi:beta-glucuronidase